MDAVTFVELRIDPVVSAIATVEAVGLSGALLETRGAVAVLSRVPGVGVRPISIAGLWLEARVLHVEDTRITVEWVDPRVDHLSVLLSLHRDASAPGMRAIEENRP